MTVLYVPGLKMESLAGFSFWSDYYGARKVLSEALFLPSQASAAATGLDSCVLLHDSIGVVVPSRRTTVS